MVELRRTDMRKILFALLGLTSLTLFGANQAFGGASFCYDKNTGEFAHWDTCPVVCNYYGEGCLVGGVWLQTAPWRGDRI
jgi:hypothetical protein